MESALKSGSCCGMGSLGGLVMGLALFMNKNVVRKRCLNVCC